MTSPHLTQVDAERYRRILESVAITAPDAVEADPVNVASTLVATFDRTVDEENGWTRTHGTTEYAPVTMYASDVVAITDRTEAEAAESLYRGRETRGAESKLDVDRYAVGAAALDLEAALEREVDR